MKKQHKPAVTGIETSQCLACFCHHGMEVVQDFRPEFDCIHLSYQGKMGIIWVQIHGILKYRPNLNYTVRAEYQRDFNNWTECRIIRKFKTLDDVYSILEDIENLLPESVADSFKEDWELE